MSGEDMRWDRETKHDYIAVPWSDDGPGEEIRFDNSNLNELFAEMQRREVSWYEVKLADPASSNR